MQKYLIGILLVSAGTVFGAQKDTTGFVDLVFKVVIPSSWSHKATNIGELEKFLVDNPRINLEVQNNHGDTALRAAARFGRMDVVKLLLDRGAQVNGRGENDSTPLMDAVNHDQAEVAQFLINKGADINAQDKNGWTPLLLARNRDNLAMIKRLIANGANPDIQTNASKLVQDSDAIKKAIEDGKKERVQLISKAVQTHPKLYKDVAGKIAEFAAGPVSQ